MPNNIKITTKVDAPSIILILIFCHCLAVEFEVLNKQETISAFIT